MSYTVDEKSGKVTMKCDHKGCTKKITGDKKGLINIEAKNKGWKGFSASEHYCEAHKEEHGARPAAKKADSKKASAKSAKSKVRGKADARGKVVNYNLNAE